MHGGRATCAAPGALQRWALAGHAGIGWNGEYRNPSHHGKTHLVVGGRGGHRSDHRHLLTLALTGAAKATLLSDSGAVVRWGRPLISVLVDIASAVTMGGTMLLAFVLPRTHGAWERVRVMVMVSAPAWTVALAAQIIFSYAATAGRPLGAPGFIDELLYYVTELGAGRARLTALVLAALTSVVMAAISGYGTALFAWVMSVSVIIPVAVTGHAAGAENHDLAMNASFMHIIGAGLWMGGLLCLMASFTLLRHPEEAQREETRRRKPG